MTMIMVSYRRADAQDMAGRISDHLIGKYGEKSVFFDFNSISTGVNYRKRIEKAIRESDVIVAVVGLHWLGQTPDGKPPRLHEANDPVRVELETAMKHSKPILPLLVNGARMPNESELPDSLRELSSYNAAKVDSGQDFRMHMRRLADSIDELLNGSEGQSFFTVPMPSPLRRFSGYGAGALAVAGLGFLLWPGTSFEWPKTKPTPIPTPTALPQVVPASITARAKAHGGFIFADSDQRLLGEEDLKGLSSTELRIARNEIYARHGRFFVDQTLANYFSQFSWYHPRQVDVELSSLETTNVNTIQTAERRK